MQTNFSKNEQCLVLINRLLKKAPQDQNRLFERIAEPLRSHLLELHQNFNKRYPDIQAVSQKLASFQKGYQEEILAQVHPDWIYQELKKERPYFVEVILSYLAESDSKKVLQQFDKDQQKKILSKSSKTQRVLDTNPALLKTIKNRFAGQFLIQPPFYSLNQIKKFCDVAYLKRQYWADLLIQIGLTEVAYAVLNFNHKSRDLFFKRVNQGWQKKLIAIQNQKNLQISKERLRQAQIHLLEMDFEKGFDDTLLTQLGIYIFCRAVSHEDLPILGQIQQKLSIPQSKKIKFWIEKFMQSYQQKTANSYQKEIVSIINDFNKNEIKG